MAERYTRREVGRILGVETKRLRYWERLRLVCPESRWGERFYSFGDLVALQNIQRLTQNRIPARRLQRAVTLLREQFGDSPLPLQQLRLLDHGGEILAAPPGHSGLFNPFRNQWVFSFDPIIKGQKVSAMAAPTPEQLFQIALDCETRTGSLPQAIEAYERVLELAPDWVDAHINLGVALYQTGKIEDACAHFLSAAQIDPASGIANYNLGCILEEQGELREAIDRLRRASISLPGHADVHFNLALAYEKTGERKNAREQWTLYLQHAPSGAWAEHARSRLRHYSASRKPSAPIPFRRPG